MSSLPRVEYRPDLPPLVPQDPIRREILRADRAEDLANRALHQSEMAIRLAFRVLDHCGRLAAEPQQTSEVRP